MKQTLSPRTLALAGKFSKSILLPKLETLLVGIALLGFPARGWTQDGPVIAWGDSRFGQTNVPSGLSNVVDIRAGEWHNLALKADGTLIAWGADNSGQANIPSDVTNVMFIAAGGYHNLAVKADRTVRVWGQNDYGQSTVPAGLSNVVAVAGGWVHSLALKADGTVIAWGRNDEGQATVPFDLNNVVAISSGEYHNLALKADGTVTAWGYNGFGQTTIPAGLSNNVVAIAASGLHSLALKTDGTVTAWGWNDFGQATVPAGLSNVAAITGGAEHSLALKSDGTVVAWGNNTAWANNDPNCAIVGHPCERKYAGQIDVPAGLGNVVAITAGVFHSMALKANGTSSPYVRLSNPTRVGNTFNCSANTQSGRVYVLQYKDSLATTNWNSFSSVPGTGAERVFIDSTAGVARRFYRLRRW
jgi:alpha-tubulin suppressor-like RCC1 family protein